MLPPRIEQAAVADRIGPYADSRATLEERGAIYQELLGFVPPRIEARLAVTGALDPELLDLQERLRAHARSTNRKVVDVARAVSEGHALLPRSPDRE